MFNRKTKLLSMREILRRYHNTFIDKLVANILDLTRHIDIAQDNPSFTRPNQMGQPVSVQNLIKENIKGVDNVKEYLGNIDYLLTLSDNELLHHAETLKDADVPEVPEPKPEPKEKYKVIKGVEYPKGTVRKVGDVLELEEKEATDFAPGLIEKVKA